jgi:undecaprenyl-diphosphatase
VHRSLLLVALAAALAVIGLVFLLKSNPYLQLDADIERAIQSVTWGPLAVPFPFFRWAGGPGGVYTQTAAVLLVLLLNYRAWLLAVAATAGGVWYSWIVNFVERPRPALPQVLQITEHPGATSFPSGHVIFLAISLSMVMLCVGYRYLPARLRPLGWALVIAAILLIGISRVYAGVHWPTDVLGSMLIVTAWMSLVTSIRWLSDRALSPRS